jgi:hypothetical protein
MEMGVNISFENLIWRFSFDVEFIYVNVYWLTMWQIDKAHPFIEERNERH